jgi:hypothetical protein
VPKKGNSASPYEPLFQDAIKVTIFRVNGEFYVAPAYNELIISSARGTDGSKGSAF